MTTYKRLKELLRKVKSHNICEFRDPCGADYHITLESLELEKLLTDIITDKYIIDSSTRCKEAKDGHKPAI